MISQIVIAIAVLIVIFVIFGYISKRLKMQKVNKILEEDKENFQYVYDMDHKLQDELKRCEKISKNDKTKELLNNWKKEYDILKESIDDIKDQEVELNELADLNDYKNFFKEHEEVMAFIENLRPYIDKFYEKLKNYTNYEIDNIQMALSLKEKLKELTNEFDQKIKILDVYNAAFVENTTEIKLLINKFEEEQKKGNYPRARVVLKECNDSLVALEKNINLIISYYDIMYGVEEQINSIKEMKDTINNSDLEELKVSIDVAYSEYSSKRESLLEEAKKIDFKDTDSLEISLNELKYFEESLLKDIKKYKKNYEIIEEIFNIQKENEEKMKLIDELIVGALEEKSVIEKLYSLADISHFDNIEDEKEKFEQFKVDYEELNNLFIDESNDFSVLHEKFLQSNRYLERVLSNVKYIIEGLQAIRSDEIEILEKIDIYKREMFNIDLYLRENDHYDKVSSALESMYNEINQKIKILDEELSQEPLDIGNVRINNDIIEKLIRKFTFDMETDIKQRKGVEKLTLYYNRFITTHEYLEYYKHFLSLYNTREYRQILKEIHKLFVQINPRGDDLYKNIVSTIKIEEYKSEI